MAASPASLIERAAHHILELLSKHNELVYSEHFYDGSDAVHEKLMAAIGLDDDWYSAEGLVDLAAGQLKVQQIGVKVMSQKVNCCGGNLAQRGPNRLLTGEFGPIFFKS